MHMPDGQANPIKPHHLQPNFSQRQKIVAKFF